MLSKKSSETLLLPTTKRGKSAPTTVLQSTEDEKLIARLCSGHHSPLRAYLHRLDRDIDPVFPTCKEEDHTLHHWLITCLGRDCLQQKLFDCPKGRLEWRNCLN